MQKRFLLLALLLCAVSVHGQAVGHVTNDAGINNSSGASLAQLTIPAPASGAVLVVAGSTRVQHLLGTGNGVCNTAVSTTPGGNSFADAPGSNVYDSVNGIYNYMCYAVNVTNGPTTVNVNINANSTNTFEVTAIDITGADTSSPLDVSAFTLATGCAGACTNVNPVASANFTTNFANEIIICAISEPSNTFTFGSPTNSFLIQNNLTNPGHNIQLSRIVTNTLTTSCGGTMSTATFWGISVASFKSSSQPVSASKFAGPSKIAGPSKTD